MLDEREGKAASCSLLVGGDGAKDARRVPPSPGIVPVVGMRIVFVFAVFPPESPPAAVMAKELVEYFAGRGDDVMVVAPFPSRPGGVRFPGFRRSLWRREKLDTADLFRTACVTIGTRRAAWRRVLENVSFGIGSSLILAIHRRPDVVVVETWPVLASFLSLAVCRLRLTPTLNYVQDLYPEALESAGLLRRGGAVAQALLGLDRIACQLASRTVAVSVEMAEQIRSTRRVRPDDVVVVPNWIDLEHYRPGVRGGAWRGTTGLGRDEFVVLFAGTVGHASGAHVLADLAEKLRDESSIRVVCVGDGPLREALDARRERDHLWNLLLVPRQPVEAVSSMFAAADVCLLTTASGMGASSVPSKFIGYLAAGRPVVVAASPSSEIAVLVESEGIGWTVAPDDADGLAVAVRHARDVGPAARAEMGRTARRVAETRYSKESALARFDALIDSVAGKMIV
jgi:colanic acid biosynthesis glycosyl transferase WcaI